MCSNLYIQTSIMAVEFDGGVIIGADSRTSSGYGAVTCTCQGIVLYIAYRTFLWGGGGGLTSTVSCIQNIHQS